VTCNISNRILGRLYAQLEAQEPGMFEYQRGRERIVWVADRRIVVYYRNWDASVVVAISEYSMPEAARDLKLPTQWSTPLPARMGHTYLAEVVSKVRELAAAVRDAELADAKAKEKERAQVDAKHQQVVGVSRLLLQQGFACRAVELPLTQPHRLDVQLRNGISVALDVLHGADAGRVRVLSVTLPTAASIDEASEFLAALDGYARAKRK
jgi:hypothetical protein